MLCLNNPYISVLIDGKSTYGGCQQYSDDVSIARCGCGVVAAMDCLLYLSRYRSDCPIAELSGLCSDPCIPKPVYENMLQRLNRRYFPLIPNLGMNGLGLALGMNLLFRRCSLPMKAKWGVPHSRLWESMEEMLRSDIPVILSIGPNFPLFWQAHKQALYIRLEDGHYIKAAETKAHYVTATGLDEKWIQVSSWGQKYYLNREEYLRFSSQHTTSLLSNILYIKKK